MAGGKIKEFDNPNVLLQDKNSLFYSLYNETRKENKF